MAIKIEGMEIFQKQLERLAADIQKINRGALGEAAGYVADEMKSALEGMPVRDDSTHPHMLYGATASEKAQIIQNFGISHFDDGGDLITTSVGFTGYVDTPSRRFNNKVPTGMLMQCIEYGTSFRKGTHTIGNTANRLREGAARKSQDYIDKRVKEIMN